MDTFYAEFNKESDRARVILAAAMLEEMLEAMLRSYFVPIASADDSLFMGANAPLASFSAKIDIAHRIVVISTRLCRDLHLVRKIRNDFAHNVAGCSFESSGVRSRVIELLRSSVIIDPNPDFKEVIKTARDEFAMTASRILWHLTRLRGQTRPLKDPELEFGYTLTEESEENKQGEG
jgi:hypothetical protein